MQKDFCLLWAHAFITLLFLLFSPLSYAGSGCLAQDFPTQGTPQVRWSICYKTRDQFGLVIRDVSIAKYPDFTPITILRSGRISEITVPYASGTPIYRDMTDALYTLLPLTDTDCPATRARIIKTDMGDICMEVRNRGLAWKYSSISRQGEELVLWSALQAANYHYLMEWHFSDEGAITSNVGSTGPKLQGADDTLGHVHAFTWRFDIDLNGPEGDTAYQTSYIESPNPTVYSAKYTETLIAQEMALVWQPEQFNKIRVYDNQLTNSRGRLTGYELQCGRPGISRPGLGLLNYLTKEYWVTVANNKQLMGSNLPEYVDGESTQGANIVVWYNATAPHETNMRDEDRQTVPVKWLSCTWTPQNLFDNTPMFPLDALNNL